MAIDRRTFLVGLGAGAIARPAVAAEPGPVFISSAFSDGANRASVFDSDGQLVAAVDLPDRGHGCAVDPSGRVAVVFARRPNRFAVAFEPRSDRVVASISAPDDRHFYGHGVFSRDGRLLYTTENDFDGERGVIGVWDAGDGYRRVTEFDSLGIGPHDIRLMPDGATLAVANGGIATHPETGRRKLNIAEMKPSLVLVDARSGALISRCRLPDELHKLSIRHLAVAGSGKIAAAMQYEGPEDDTPPLLVTWGGGEPDLHHAPADVQGAMRNYCGAIAMDNSGRSMAVSCPRGGLVTFWNGVSGAFLHAMSIEDGCGVTATPADNEFLVTSGTGERVVYDAMRERTRLLPRATDTAWDNHVEMGVALHT